MFLMHRSHKQLLNKDKILTCNALHDVSNNCAKQVLVLKKRKNKNLVLSVMDDTWSVHWVAQSLALTLWSTITWNPCSLSVAKRMAHYCVHKQNSSHVWTEVLFYAIWVICWQAIFMVNIWHVDCWLSTYKTNPQQYDKTLLKLPIKACSFAYWWQIQWWLWLLKQRCTPQWFFPHW